MRPLRLLTVGHSYATDANRDLAHAMQAAGGSRWAVTVAAPTYFHGRRDLRPAVLHVGPAEPVPVVPVRAYLTWQVHTFHYGRRLRALLADKWDVVHAWEEPYILAGAQIARWAPAGARYVFRTAQSLPKVYPPPFSWAERATVRRADGWICSGTTVEKNLLARPGYGAKPMARIPLGVDTRRFQPDPAAGARVRRNLGWAAGGPPVVGFLGRFVPEKGLPLLMRVLPELKSPWRALILGGGPLEAAARRFAAAWPSRVRVLTGIAHADVPAYLNAMDLLAAPSQTTPRWREQFGRMLVEAFAAGVPVVGSDSGEIPAVVGGTGVVVPEADEAAWVRALGELIDDPARRADLAAAAMPRAADEFDWPVVGRKHVRFFEALLDGPAAALPGETGRFDQTGSDTVRVPAVRPESDAAERAAVSRLAGG